MSPSDFAGPAAPLTDQDLAAAASALGVSIARIRAVDQVESNGRGFHPETRRPVILFEPHVFSRLTSGRFDASHPDLSYPKWGERPYPAAQSQRYDQLAAAMALDEGAALQSASWGRFQIMGYNFKPAGFASVRDMVRALVRSEGAHLAAFASLVSHSAGMLAALRAGDWAGFARAYNGPGYAQHGYDQKLKAAYARLTAPAASQSA
ncbi:MAG: N-acetylmuramidase family protein [Caulobacterales bacterium]|nr:N-acetylmuramidase family protein [Caulobacterales bacterium]